MKKGDINWEEFAKELLWRNVVHEKNLDSGYDIDGRGEIGPWRYSSTISCGFKALTWKELALELDLFNELLLPDGHNCHQCPKEKTCNAFFKYDTDHERCDGWKDEYFNNKDSREK